MKIESSYTTISAIPSPASISPEQASQNRELIQAVRAINESQQANLGESTYLQFGVDRDLHRPIVKVMDPVTNEVVMQIPNERVLEMARELKLLSK